jgi:DNA-binding transcriptional ArsR family regulator
MNETAYRASRILRALGNPLRYRILARLARFPATPGQLARELSRPLYVISHHLALLRALDLIWFHPVDRCPVYSVKYRLVRLLLLVAERCAKRLRAEDPGKEPAGEPVPGDTFGTV